MSAVVPSIEPAAATESKSSGTSRCSAVKYGVDEPPGVQNFSSCPGRMPPAISSSSRHRVPTRASFWPRHLQKLSRRRPHRGLVLAGTDHATGERVDLRAGRLLRAELLEPLGAAAD